MPIDPELLLSMHDAGPRRPVSLGGFAVGAEGGGDAHVPEPAAVKREVGSKKRQVAGQTTQGACFLLWAPACEDRIWEEPASGCCRSNGSNEGGADARVPEPAAVDNVLIARPV